MEWGLEPNAKAVRSFFFFVVFLFLLGASLYGVVTPKNVPVAIVGAMQIAPFKDGLSLYQGNRGEYYVFSPFNDYIIDGDGTRSSLISQQELTNKAYATTFKSSRLNDIKDTIAGYLRITNPQMIFWTKKTIKYAARAQDNKLKITENIIFPVNSTLPQIIGSTMSYQTNDFVYDSSGNLYNFKNDADLSAFEKIYGVSLKPTLESLRIAIPDGKIMIVNPNLSGIMVIYAKPEQRLLVNRNFNLIELEQAVKPENNSYTASISVDVYKNPKEAETNL